MKTCLKCNATKAIDDFYRAANTKDGYRNHCKTCHRAEVNRWYQRFPEHAKANARHWQRRNRKRSNQLKLAWKKKQNA